MYGMWWKDDSDDDFDISVEEFADYDNDVFDYTPLFLAVHEGDLNRFNVLLDKRQLEKVIRRRTMMHVAAARGHAQMVNLLCQRNSLITRRDEHGNTPLYLAIKHNHPEVFNLLLPKSNLNAKNFSDKRPLHLAAAENRVQFAEMLLKNGADINAEDMDGKTPLFFALAGNHAELAELLLQNGANIHVADMQGKTPLHLATEIKNTHLVEIILKKGARVNVLDEDKDMTPIQIAAELNNIQLVEMLLKHGAKFDQLDEAYEGQEQITETMTPLHFAAQAGNLEMIKLLIKNGFDTLDVKNEESETPLHLAVINNHLEVIKYLIENGSKIVSDSDDISLLELCNSNKHIKVLKYLIDLGVKYHDDTGEDSLLYSALCDGHLELWEYLLTCISKITANLCSRETKLHSAIRANQVEIVKEIINKQTSCVESNSLSSKLAVFMAVENENEKILKVLLEAGCSVESCFDDKLSPLHIAATFKNTRFVEMLLKAGAEINTKTVNNVTPVDFAAAAGRSSVVKFLLDAGADVLKAKQYDLTSLDYALNRKPYNESESNVTPAVYQNLIQIAEMLIIAGLGEIKDKYHFDNLLNYAVNLRVSSGNEPSSLSFNLKEESDEENIHKKTNIGGEFRPEIVRCLLNYLQEDKLNDSLNSVIRNDELLTPDALDVLLEYYDSKSQIKISHLNRSYLSNVHIINQIEDIDSLLNAVQKSKSIEDSDKDHWTNLLKVITARLVLLPSDQQTETRKFDFYKNYKLLMCQDECQRQIISMQITKPIEELNVSFYNILINSVDKVARYIREENFLNCLESSYQKFPAYAKFLEIRVNNGKQRNDLMDLCVKGMFHFIAKNHKIKFSYNGVEKIVQYLSVSDLRRLSAAYSTIKNC